MSYYTLAVYLWSGVAAAGIVAPLLAFAAREARKTVDLFQKDDALSSRPSFCHQSAPSHPGY